jgi:hypothetical protein
MVKGALLRNGLNDSIRGLLYVSLLVSILLYGSETWIMTKGIMDKLRKFHHSCVRSMCGIESWHQHVSPDTLLKRLNIKPIEFYYRRRLLQWVGHVTIPYFHTFLDYHGNISLDGLLIQGTLMDRIHGVKC